MRSEEIREVFLDFFRKKGHVIKDSAPLIPQDDPTLLFTTAGMNQFKKEFLGKGDPALRRVATCQKCLRTSDIQEVGKTGRHHTFFEMLGNFSFGDYFKEEAILWAWELVRETFRIPEEKLWITIYKEDEEAFRIWKEKVGVKEERIVRLGEETNFWEMGPTGPCGPCSEIVVDRGEEFSCGKPDCDITCDCDRYLELWNLVFTQFDRQEDGTLKPLPRRNIDTGMGLERACAILQNRLDNYLTDLFLPLIQELEEMSGRDYSSSIYSFRVIADHIRAITFLLNEGVLPSNTGRGYVLRRLIRRGVVVGKRVNLSPPFLYRLVPRVIEKMESFYPDLKLRKEHIIQALHAEESSFSRTLEEGKGMLEEMVREVKEKGERIIPGDKLFRLYDTYGFPLEITRELVKEEGLTLDEEGFQREMEKQKRRAREDWEKSRKEIKAEGRIYTRLRERWGETRFTGYEKLEGKTKILSLIQKGEEKEEIREGEEIEILLESTPFYAESGGQVGDRGFIKGKDGIVEIEDTYYGEEGLIIHFGKVREGWIRKGEEVWVEVDKKRRKRIAIHHTTTHLLQFALREVLGTHVYQAGSWVGEEGFRFDFTHYSAPHPEELRKVEELVNEKIRENVGVEVRYLSLEEAKREGAIALFGEKYGETVRMIKIGDFSKELCGGTHLSSTGEIGIFLLLQESSVGRGIRRIEGAGGDIAYRILREEREILDKLEDTLKVSRKDIIPRIKELEETIKRLSRREEELLRDMIREKARESLKHIQEVGDIGVVVLRLKEGNREILRETVDFYRSKRKEKGVFLTILEKDSPLMVLGITQDLIERGIHAGNLLREIARILGGGGGGKPHLAEAGGKDKTKIEEAIQLLYKKLSSYAYH